MDVIKKSFSKPLQETMRHWILQVDKVMSKVGSSSNYYKHKEGNFIKYWEVSTCQNRRFLKQPSIFPISIILYLNYALGQSCGASRGLILANRERKGKSRVKNIGIRVEKHLQLIMFIIIKKMSKYSIISEKRRVQLIDLIKKEGKTIVSAAKKLKIKISTAKSILYSFQRNGKVLRKKKNQKIDKLKSLNSSSVQIDDLQSKNSQKPQIKNQESQKPQQSQKLQEFKTLDPICINPMIMFNPVWMGNYWNYYPFYEPYQQFFVPNLPQ